MKQPQKTRNHPNELTYHANTNQDLTRYINTSVAEWISMATNRSYPIIINFCIYNENNRMKTFTFPVFPSNIERTADSLFKYVNGQNPNKINQDDLTSSKIAYKDDILNYIKNEIASTYLTAMFENDEETMAMLNLDMMKDFEFKTFGLSLYSEDLELPQDQQKYQKDYVHYVGFKKLMEPLADSAQKYYNKYAKQSQFGGNQ